MDNSNTVRVGGRSVQNEISASKAITADFHICNCPVTEGWYSKHGETISPALAAMETLPEQLPHLTRASGRAQVGPTKAQQWFTFQ